MATKKIRPFKPSTSNIEALNAIRMVASNDYQGRVPETTKANLQANLRHLAEYQPDRNEAIDALVNRIGSVIARNISWQNPLAQFKQGIMAWGDTIEEVQLGLLKAKVYDPQREYLEKDIFGTEPTEAQSRFHTITRQEFYKVSVNDSMIRRAFLDESGLASMVNQLMEQPTTSDQWDEFLQTTALIKEYHKLHGFHAVKVPDVKGRDSGSDEAKTLLRYVRTYADRLTFISRDFNPAGMPTHAKRDDLMLLVSPEVNAAIDVEALAAAFNIERADVNLKVIVIPDENMGIDGAQAILTTKDFFLMADTLLENRNADNPASLVRNYFLHHHSILSVSTFVPAILFTTKDEDVITIVETPVTGIEDIVVTNPAGEKVTSLERGSFYDVESDAITTPANGDNNGVRFELIGATADRTRLTQDGTLIIPQDEAATSVKIRAIATGVEEGKPEVSTEATYNLTGDILVVWPNPKVDEGGAQIMSVEDEGSESGTTSTGKTATTK